MVSHSRQAGHSRLMRGYLTLALIEGLLALAWLILIPSENGGGGLSALSLSRLAFISPLLIVITLLSWAVASAWLRSDNADRWASWLSAFALNGPAYWGTLVVTGTISVVGINFLGTRTSEPFMQAYLVRLAPYAAFLAVSCIQTMLLLRILRAGWSMAVFRPYRGVFYAGLQASGFLLLIAGVLVWTGIGLRPDIVAWGSPGVPLLPSQVWLALAITLSGLVLCSLAIYLWRRQRRDASLNIPSWLIDGLICLLLWGVAVWHWNAEPLQPSYFAPDPTPPNQEYYPYSDAGNYDLSAQRLLVGAKFEPDVVRPVYSLFLAAAQAVSGIGYQSAIAWQIALLALIPVLLYLLAKALHHPLSGFLLALLVIFHESNSLVLTGIINLSNAKMLMSGLPTALGVILFSLVVVLWLQRPDRRQVYPILAGGILGVFMLVRVQIALLLPAALLCAGLALRRRPKLWLKGSAAMMAALLLTLSPWLYRNWQMTGKVVLAGTTNISQAGLLGQRYNQSIDTENSARLSGEADDEYLFRMAGSALQYAFAHPLEAASFIAAHFWHNQVSTLLVLPSSFPILTGQHLPPEGLSNLETAWVFLRYQCCSPITLVRDLPYWRSDWQGSFLPGSSLPVLASIMLVGLGIGAAWTRSRFAGLLPIFVAVGYSLSNAIVRNSGWRFNLPVVWVGLLYYAIGLMQVCFWIGTFFKDQFFPRAWKAGISNIQDAELQRPFPWKQAAAAIIIFMFVVAAIPLAEALVPARYPAGALQAALNMLSSQIDAGQIDSSALRQFLGSDQATTMVGRAMYPRYYAPGEGIPRVAWPSYDVRSYPRLGFVLVGAETSPVVLPVDEPPANFLNASDVLVLGCQREDYIEARLVMRMKDPKTILLASPSPPLDCSSP